MKNNNLILKLFFLTTTISCGGYHHDHNDYPTQTQQEEQTDSGHYTVNFDTLNGTISGNNTKGVGEITIDGNTISVKVAMAGSPPNIIHMQHIHTGSSCPDASADVNGDGHIDILEGLPAYGKILIPLDGDLSTQAGGNNGYPSANNLGIYSYSGSGSLDQMIADLRGPDTNPTDAVDKLPAGTNLNLAGKVIVIHGVDTSASLPSTVATLPGMTSNQTLPIACGTIVRQSSGSDSAGTSQGGSGGGTTGTSAI